MEGIVKIAKKQLNTITRNHLDWNWIHHKWSTLKPPKWWHQRLWGVHVKSGTANPNLLICPVEKPRDIVNKQKWKAVQVALQSFWQRWIREYLPIITTRKKWNIATRNFVVGDLVLIADKNIPRSNWLLARITEIHRSKDNVIRVVKLKTKFGTYTRPAANLSLLEESLAKKWILTLIID